ncbi:transposase [Paenibacillus sp. SN-8-1]|uniref:transposase n=1 Tax=Paenibacillus sp. SN-8-1 TaxID=3435409 RepID=UPI003D9A1390
MRKYSLELKMEAVRLVNEEQRRSIREVTKQLGVRNKSQVQTWATKFRTDEILEPTPQDEDGRKRSFPVWK